MNLASVKKLNLPKVPGCYLFKDNTGKIIYIGKAVNLHSRVLSYFRERASHSPAKHSMMKKISTIEIIEVDTEIEALLLESNLIKKHAPEYNVVMRDDKRHTYIKVSTEDEYPRIFSTRKLDKTGRYFGPFISAESVRETLKTIRRIWPFRSCKNLPKKTCLYYRLGKCPGCCECLISKTEYRKIVKNIILFLEGKKSKIIKNYEVQIKKLESKKSIDEDEINRWKYRLLNMRKVLDGSNILSVIDKYAADVVELAKVLSLPKVPNRIEGYDISNIQGRDAVGSMVVFNEGEANKSEYKKFKIKDEKLEGDVWMMKEVFERRIKNDWQLPDLVIVDGAKAQLNVMTRILKINKLDIPVIAISKGEGLRSSKAPDKIFFPGEKKPLELPIASPALHVIKRVRDEAHRFAINYHRKVRGRRYRT